MLAQPANSGLRVIASALKACALALLLSGAWIGITVGSGTAVAGDSVVASPAVAAGGMRVYVDPDSGELLDSAPAGEAALARSVAGGAATTVPLVEQAAPGGGVMVVVGDRFHHAIHATVDSRDELTTRCATADPEPGR